jgi:hypothetical protein
MSHPHQAPERDSADPLESIIHLIPLVIPLTGGLMIFLLAFIAVFMA